MWPDATDAFPVPVDRAHLARLCEKWGIVELAAFGSIWRSDFGPESDLDLLVAWDAGRSKPRLFDLLALRDELAGFFGRSVDLLERHVVESDENPYRRASILSTARAIYVAELDPSPDA